MEYCCCLIPVFAALPFLAGTKPQPLGTWWKELLQIVVAAMLVATAPTLLVAEAKQVRELVPQYTLAPPRVAIWALGCAMTGLVLFGVRLGIAHYADRLLEHEAEEAAKRESARLAVGQTAPEQS